MIGERRVIKGGVARGRWRRKNLLASLSSPSRAGHAPERLSRRGLPGLVCAAICGAAWAANPPDLVKPAPDARMQPFRERLTSLVRAHYPELLVGSFVGTPVLTVLFNPDGSVDQSNLHVHEQPSGTLTATEAQFEGFGLRNGELQYVGEARLELSHRTVYVVFGARSSEALDRELFERYFPQAVTGVVKGAGDLWILFDHAGRVVKTGEAGVDSTNLRGSLETRYPGIHIADATVAPVIARDGHPVENARHEGVQLNCLWLAVNSPLPPK